MTESTTTDFAFLEPVFFANPMGHGPMQAYVLETRGDGSSMIWDAERRVAVLVGTLHLSKRNDDFKILRLDPTLTSLGMLANLSCGGLHGLAIELGKRHVVLDLSRAKTQADLVCYDEMRRAITTRMDLKNEHGTTKAKR